MLLNFKLSSFIEHFDITNQAIGMKLKACALGFSEMRFRSTIHLTKIIAYWRGANMFLRMRLTLVQTV